MTGIACAGNWVIDHEKIIDRWPKRTELCTILSDSISGGGGPFNVLCDLRNLQHDIPLYGIGCIGDAPANLYVNKICNERKINIECLHKLKNEETSYTDAMTLKRSGERTMFHFRGANRKFSLEHVPLEQLKEKKIKYFYLGHLLLLDALEQKDSDFKVKAACLLHDIQQAGIETIVDIATERSRARYQHIIIPTLPYVDHFIINELEASLITKLKTRIMRKVSLKNLKKAARILFDLGVKKNVVIHMPEGAYWLTNKKKGTWHPSFKIPKHFFVATTGAGDAFCSGIIYGLYNKWNTEKTLRLAMATAALAMSSSHNSDGIKPLAETLETVKKFPLRSKIKYD